MSYETLKFSLESGVARIQFDRPTAANSINLQCGQDLMAVAIRCDAPDVRAVILTGEGKMFCAGGDLASFASQGAEISAALKELTGYMHLAVSRFARMSAPLIAAVNGVAAGAGMSIVCGADLVLASDRARFTMAYTGAGLAPDGGATWSLPRLVGLRRAQELMITNRMLSAQEAADWGLVTRVVAADALAEEAGALAAQLAAGPRGAYGHVKRLLQHSASGSLETQMELESRAISEAAVSPEGQEGIRAFLEKRSPRFTKG